MAETIPGGAYKLADGSWINAQGKPIAAPKGEVYIPPEEEEVSLLAPLPGDEEEVSLLAPLPGDEEFGTAPDMVSEVETPQARRSRSKKS